MTTKFCLHCQTPVVPEDVNFSLRCPKCKTPFPETPGESRTEFPRPVGFGTSKTTTRRRGTGWG